MLTKMFYDYFHSLTPKSDMNTLNVRSGVLFNECGDYRTSYGRITWNKRIRFSNLLYLSFTCDLKRTWSQISYVGGNGYAVHRTARMLLETCDVICELPRYLIIFTLVYSVDFDVRTVHFYILFQVHCSC